MASYKEYEVLNKEHAVFPGHALTVAYVIMHVFDGPEAALDKSDAQTRLRENWPAALHNSDVPGSGDGAHAGISAVSQLQAGKSPDEVADWCNENWKARVGPGTGNHEDALQPGQEQADKFREQFIAKAKEWTVRKAKEFPIGTTFQTRGKRPRLCKVVDIHKTYNHAGDLVKVRYVATHECAGQTVTDRDVPATTIAMGLLKEG